MTTAILDACVLYPAALRDLFMHLTARFVFQPKWTFRIHAEWIENILENRPDITRAQLERTRDLMNRWARDWRVPAHEALIETLTLPDPGDRHVLAAAIAARVPLIVTFNLSDFPDATLAPYGICAQYPDEFACDLLDEAQGAFLTAVRTHRSALQRPPKSVGEYLGTLSTRGLNRTTARLSEHRDAI